MEKSKAQNPYTIEQEGVLRQKNVVLRHLPPIDGFSHQNFFSISIISWERAAEHNSTQR
jgi:hypothetical protein